MEKARSILLTLIVVVIMFIVYWFLNQSVSFIPNSNDSNKITLTAYLPLDSPRTVIEEFEALHPNINVEIVQQPPGPEYPPLRDTTLEEYLDNTEQYVETADVLIVSTYNLSLQATNAGYYLNLAPLVDSDSDLVPNSEKSVLWNSFRWNNGLWAVPIGGRAIILGYRPEAFDENNLQYPSESWSLADISRVGRILAKRNDKGEIIKPALVTLDYQHILFRSLLGENLYTTDGEIRPNLYIPKAEKLLEEWNSLIQEGVVQQYPTDGGIAEIPMVVSLLDITSTITNKGNPEFLPAPLPGGTLGLRTYGFAVNSQTQYPKLAYELAVFLAHHSEMALAVRPDYYAYPDSNGQLEITHSTEQANFLDTYFDLALPFSQTHFASYLNRGLDEWGTDADINMVLLSLQDIAEEEINVVNQRNPELTMDSPAPRPTLPAGQIELRFGTVQALTDPQNPVLKDIVKSFVDMDPEVGAIEFPEMPNLQDIATDDLDCFYRPYSVVNSIPQNYLLPLSPYIEADNVDFMAPVLNPLRGEDNQIYGYPIVLLPTVIWYSTDQVNTDASIIQNWDWNDFATLMEYTNSDGPTFVPPIADISVIWSLVAAQDVLPYDMHNNPPTLNLSDPKSVIAIRNVLDLAKEKLMVYKPLAEHGINIPPETAVFNGELWTTFAFKQHVTDTYDAGLLANSYSVVGYPIGSYYYPLMYDIGSGYITSFTQYQDACFRWLRHLSANAYRFSGIPARSDLLETHSPENPNIGDFQNEFINGLSDSRAYPIPIVRNRYNEQIAMYVEQHWIAEAFDNYVFNDAVLDVSLLDVESRIQQYRQCREAIVSQEPMDRQNRIDMEMKCIESLDPELIGDIVVSS